MRIFLTVISIIWILMNLLFHLPRLANYNLSSRSGTGGLLGSLLAIGLLISPEIWYLWKGKKNKI